MSDLRDRTAFLEGSGELADTLDEDLRRGMVEMLATAHKAKQEASRTGTYYESLKTLLKRWLEAHEGEVLYDGEREITAQLKPVKMPGGPDVDLISLREHNPALFERLFHLGCLSVNIAVTKAQKGQVSGWEKYAMERGVRWDFDLQRKEEGNG